jgi:hypothetical protein
MNVHQKLLAVATFAFALAASADEEAAPRPLVVSSPSGVYYFRLEPSPDRDEKKSRGRMYRVSEGEEILEYESNGWYSFTVMVANDGAHVARAGPWPRFDSAPEKTPALVFYEYGAPVKTYYVSDLVEDLSNLQYSVSHFRWGSDPHWAGDPQNYEIQVTTVEGKVVKFDIRTAEIIE